MPTVETCLPLRKLHVCLASLLGASAAFAALPSGYTELQYIQGTGDAGAYICANESTDSGQFGFGVNQYLTKTGGQVADARMRMSLVLGMAHISRGWSQQFDMSAVSPANFNGNIYVGTVNTESLAAGAPMDIYRFKVFNGSTLVHDFVPVQRTSDGAVGLYDTFCNLGFRGAADAQFVSAGSAYSGNDSEWLEVAAGSGLVIFFQ